MRSGLVAIGSRNVDLPEGGPIVEDSREPIVLRFDRRAPLDRVLEQTIRSVRDEGPVSLVIDLSTLDEETGPDDLAAIATALRDCERLARRHAAFGSTPLARGFGRVLAALAENRGVTIALRPQEAEARAWIVSGDRETR